MAGEADLAEENSAVPTGHDGPESIVTSLLPSDAENGVHVNGKNVAPSHTAVLGGRGADGETTSD